MKDLIDYIARSLVDDPSQVEISQGRRGSQVILRLKVAKEYLVRVIGKSGRVANAMRVLLKVSAAQEGKRATLDIVEPQ
jgi:predicted RNA-binding protein YlqC (UPF0109 family)